MHIPTHTPVGPLEIVFTAFSPLLTAIFTAFRFQNSTGILFYLTHAINDKREGITPCRAFYQGMVLCSFPINSTGFFIVCVFCFGKSVTTAQCTSVWITELMLQSTAGKFFWSSSVLYREDTTTTCRMPLAEGFWKCGTLSYWPSTVYKSDICRLLCTFIRHETHWVQNLHGFQLMNKSQLNLCWLRIGLRLKISSPCLGRLCLIAIPSEKSLF